jgi:hypothetical protein
MSLRCAVRRVVAAAVLVGSLPLTAASSAGAASINSRDLREWLTYIASDDLQGRAVFTTGIGLAAAYIEEHLRTWGVKPAGDNGSYLQTVRVLGVRTTSRSRVTVQVGDETRTFDDGGAIRFPRDAGARQHLEINHVEFAGYGLDMPGIAHEDYGARNVAGSAVVWLGGNGPAGIDPSTYRLLLGGRSRYAIEERGAAASIGVTGAAAEAGRATAGSGRSDSSDSATQESGRGRAEASAAGSRAAGRGRGAIPAPDFTTAERLDRIVPPSVTATDAFFTFLFSHAPMSYEELRRKAEARDPLPVFRIDGVRITFDVDADYEVVRTQRAQNVVGVVEGSDPQLKGTYVVYGAHYDHVGYAEGEVVNGSSGLRRVAAPGRVTPGAENDRIWNGADDDGSGTVTLMGLARAFALGPRPKRSALFIWHTGEERGRWGSLYFTSHPTVPLDRIVAQLNIDMVGRNRDNRTSESDTVYLVGSDRISSELDAITRAANASLPKPMQLDYEFNEPADPEQLYYRSDHYSYAAAGIPVIFFTTGLHPDYHANTDEVARIEFDKLTRVAQFVYETGARLANLDHAPARDRKGPRAGRTTTTTR